MEIIVDKKPRVYCLYRVSTLQQVEKDDIPMQRQYCRDFAEEQGWEIVKEVIEKGVSGFKVSAEDRDAIQDIKAAALEKKFDVLLVFMFDRLGRRDDETPFVLQWFVKNGIRVWSAKEGEQRFDSHIDNLMNYLRFWQASGESEKTSIRVKTRMSQIVQEGRFRGGIPPYGYQTEKQGRINKRGHEVYEIMIDPDEAAIVKIIFEKYIYEGYGTHRLAGYLTELGIRTRKGANFVNCTIQHMLRNETYTGIIKCGDTKTDIFPDLQIIDPDTFEQAQELLRQRSTAHEERTMPLHTKGKGLLSGNIFCGHCGGRLVQTSNVKRIKKADGSVDKEYLRVRYVCYNKTRHHGQCDGQTGYTVSRVDEYVDKIVRGIFERLRTNATDSLVEAQYKNQLDALKSNLAGAKKRLAEKTIDYDSYKSEMLKVIKGESSFDRDTLNEIILETKSQLGAASTDFEQCQSAIDNAGEMLRQIQKNNDRLVSWAEMYDSSSFEAKKMIVANIVKKAAIKRDYEISLDMNISYQDYMGFTEEPVIVEEIEMAMNM